MTPRRQVAVALRYDLDGAAVPQVVAKGWGLMAGEVLRLAEAHGVPVRRDGDLAQALGRLEVGALIPPELYRAVAEVLAFLWRMNKLAAGSQGGQSRQSRPSVP